MLLKVWRKGNPNTLLPVTQLGYYGKLYAIHSKTKDISTRRPSYPASGNICKQNTVSIKKRCVDFLV